MRRALTLRSAWTRLLPFPTIPFTLTSARQVFTPPDEPSLTFFPKYIANLTLAQVKTLDCGSLRLNDFPLQLTLPGTKISTLPEMFDFVKCATDDEILFNIESKVDGDFRNLTRTPEDFTKVSGCNHGWKGYSIGSV
jgi:hypothetical protein